MGRRKKPKRTPKTPFEQPSVDKTDYEVEEIRSKCRKKGTVHYEVKWKGHGTPENTEEPFENLVGAEEEVAAFEAAWEKTYDAPAPARPMAPLSSLDLAHEENEASVHSLLTDNDNTSQLQCQPCHPAKGVYLRALNAL